MFLRSLLVSSRHKAQKIRNEIEVTQECKAERYPPLHQLVACQRKQQKWGLELAMCALEQGYLFPAFSPLKSCHVRRNIPFIIYGDSHSCLLCSCYYATCQVQALFFMERFFFVQRGEKKTNPVCRISEEIKARVEKRGLLQSCDSAQKGSRSRVLSCPDTIVFQGISRRRSTSGMFPLAPALLRHPHPLTAQGAENLERKKD